MITSTEINKSFRTVLSPILKENGFSKIESRKSWGWHSECIWVFDIKAVGNYFSEITGWPPMSICVSLGVHCEFLAQQVEIKRDNRGLSLPKQEQCHFRNNLSCWLDQSKYTTELSNPAERNRKDIWWIESDGSNLAEVIEDVKKSLLMEGLSWLNNKSNKSDILREIEERQRLLEDIEKHYAKGY